jgi:hypothetical protein
MHWNVVLEVPSQKDARGTAFWNLSISNTTPLQQNFGSLFGFQNLFQKKNSTGLPLF